MKRFKKFHEARQSTMEEYDRLFDSYYGKMLPRDKFEYLRDMSKQSESMVGLSNFQVEESDSGNLLAKWAVKGDTVYIVGILSRSGKMLKSDLDDMNDWLYRLIEYLFEGKTIVTTPNDISMMLIDRVRKQVRKMGKDISMERIGGGLKLKDDPLFRWKSYSISLKN